LLLEGRALWSLAVCRDSWASCGKLGRLSSAFAGSQIILGEIWVELKISWDIFEWIQIKDINWETQEALELPWRLNQA